MSLDSDISMIQKDWSKNSECVDTIRWKFLTDAKRLVSKLGMWWDTNVLSCGAGLQGGIEHDAGGGSYSQCWCASIWSGHLGGFWMSRVFVFESWWLSGDKKGKGGVESGSGSSCKGVFR